MLEQLWITERPRLEQWLQSSILPRHAVEEVVDEAFARVTRIGDDRLCKLGSKTATRILWRKALDVATEWHRGVAKDEFLQGQIDILQGRAISTIEDAMFRADFMAAMKRLPVPERAAFYWTNVRGLTERETAEALGVSQQTISRRCEAARTFLREELS